MNLQSHQALMRQLSVQRTIKIRIAEAEHRRAGPRCNGAESMSLAEVLKGLGIERQLTPMEPPHGSH